MITGYQILWMILTACIVLFLILVLWLRGGKCKFWKHCTCYREGNKTCTETHGWCYGIGRGGGCYRSLEKDGKLSSYYKE
jgi:hypothetical protein